MAEYVNKTDYLQDVLTMKQDIDEIKRDLGSIKEKELPELKDALVIIHKRLFESNGERSMIEIQREHGERIEKIEKKVGKIVEKNNGFKYWVWEMMVKITVGIVFILLGYVVGIKTGIIELIFKAIGGY